MIPQHENSKAIFWKNGEPLKKGDRLVQKNLGKSTELIAEHGPDAFYKGAIADQIADEMKKHGGLITKADLAGYKAMERTPVSGEYRGYEVYSMPPPSSGGIHIVQILNILENFDMQKYGFGSADAMQVMAEAEKHAYADRSEYLGDPDFVNVPWQALTSKAYAKAIAAEIDVNKAKPSSQIRPGKLAPYESNQTTHFSVVDKDGNAVAVTYTLNTTSVPALWPVIPAFCSITRWMISRRSPACLTSMVWWAAKPMRWSRKNARCRQCRRPLW